MDRGHQVRGEYSLDELTNRLEQLVLRHRFETLLKLNENDHRQITDKFANKSLQELQDIVAKLASS